MHNINRIRQLRNKNCIDVINFQQIFIIIQNIQTVLIDILTNYMPKLLIKQSWHSIVPRCLCRMHTLNRCLNIFLCKPRIQIVIHAISNMNRNSRKRPTIITSTNGSKQICKILARNLLNLINPHSLLSILVLQMTNILTLFMLSSHSMKKITCLGPYLATS